MFERGGVHFWCLASDFGVWVSRWCIHGIVGRIKASRHRAESIGVIVRGLERRAPGIEVQECK